jgi:hypothetical protein
VARTLSRGGLVQASHPLTLGSLKKTADALCTAAYVKSSALQGNLAHKKQPPPQDLPRALGIVLLWGPRGRLFLRSEVPL